MAYVTIPKDLSKVKTKIALGLTKRQLICFGIATVLGIPAYLFTRGAIGNTPATLLMITIMFPLFFFGIYEKDGMPAETILRNMVRVRFAWPGKRPYKTENLYEIMETEGKDLEAKQTAAKTPVGKRPSGEGKQKGHKKHAERQKAR